MTGLPAGTTYPRSSKTSLNHRDMNMHLVARRAAHDIITPRHRNLSHRLRPSDLHVTDGQNGAAFCSITTTGIREYNGAIFPGQNRTSSFSFTHTDGKTACSHRSLPATLGPFLGIGRIFTRSSAQDDISRAASCRVNTTISWHSDVPSAFHARRSSRKCSDPPPCRRYVASIPMCINSHTVRVRTIGTVDAKAAVHNFHLAGDAFPTVLFPHQSARTVADPMDVNLPC